MCKMSLRARKISCVKCLQQVREATFLTEVAAHRVVAANSSYESTASNNYGAFHYN